MTTLREFLVRLVRANLVGEEEGDYVRGVNAGLLLAAQVVERWTPADLPAPVLQWDPPAPFRWGR